MTREMGCPVCSRERQMREQAERDQANRERVIAMADVRLRSSGIPRRFRGIGFDSYQAMHKGQRAALAMARAYAKSFGDKLQDGGGLLLCGSQGTGKTHLASAIIEAVISAGHTARYVAAFDFIARFRATYNQQSEEREHDVIDDLAAPDLLVLDEVGVSASDHDRMVLFRLVERRYQDVRPTIMISNLSPDELRQAAGERTMDRMHQCGGRVVFDWGSWR